MKIIITMEIGGKMSKIALIVPVLKRFDLFTELMASVDYEVKPYIIDNWKNNRGCAGAWNEGMRRAILDGYDYAVISNDDVTFEPGCIKQMHKTLMETDATIVSANHNFQDKSTEKLYENISLFCFAVNIPKLINSCGSFDENFYPAYFEDNDMHYRMKLAGAKGYINRRAIAWHVGSGTQNADPENPVVPSQRFEQLRSYYVQKWGGVPGEEKYTNPFNDPNKPIWEW